MATFPTYATTDGYAALIAELEGVKNSQTTLFSDGNYTALPTGAIVWSTANARFEMWNGTAFTELVARYNISVKYLNGQLLSKSATGDTVVQRTTGGQIKAADPSAADEAVTKSWGDSRYVNESDMGKNGSLAVAEAAHADNADNANLLDGANSTAYAKLADDETVSGNWQFNQPVDADITGNAATANNADTVDGHSVQTSDLDATDGALMTVGAFGAGVGRHFQGTWLNWKNMPGGSYYWLDSDTGTKPDNSGYGQLLVYGNTINGKSTWITQLATAHKDRNLYHRSSVNDDPWTPWAKIWTDQNDGKTSGLEAQDSATADYATSAGSANTLNGRLSRTKAPIFTHPNQVGCFAMCLSFGNVYEGQTVAGGSLYFSDASLNEGGINPTGTWRCMGRLVSPGGATIFQRIS